MMALVHCPRALVEETLIHLQAGGRHRCETVVLWLGNADGDAATVREVYRPEQIVDIDFFQIPPDSMRAIMARIRETRYHIIAQVHSHPGLAFHSEADDQWAIIRRVGALSLVIPFFGQDTNTGNFAHKVATYRLNDHDRWAEASFTQYVEIV